MLFSCACLVYTAHPYPVLGPRVPPLKAATRREAVDAEGAAPRGTVRLVVDEALLGDDGPVDAHANDAIDREPCEVPKVTSQSPASHQSIISQSSVRD